MCKVKTETDKLSIVVHRYRNSFYLKNNEVDQKMTENQTLFTKRIYTLSNFDIFYKRWILPYETTVND